LLVRFVETAIAELLHDVTTFNVGEVIQEILGHQEIFGREQLQAANMMGGLFTVAQSFNHEDPVRDGLDDPAGAKPSDLKLRAAPRHAANQDIVANVQLDGFGLWLSVTSGALLGSLRVGRRIDVTI
jgi:hypothetical protein